MVPTYRYGTRVVFVLCVDQVLLESGIGVGSGIGIGSGVTVPRERYRTGTYFFCEHIKGSGTQD